MPPTCTIIGSFERRGRPVDGWVRFTPRRLWVIQDHVAWACLAPRVQLLNGCFSVEVTPTDYDGVLWRYDVETPAGTYTIAVPQTLGGCYHLKELIGEHRPGTRPSH
jgi:hypothetical protein